MNANLRNQVCISVRCRPSSDIPNRWMVKPGSGKDFWVGPTMRILDTAGQAIHESQVVAYDDATGQVELESRTAEILKAPDGFAYELDCSLPAPVLAIRQILKLAPGRPSPECTIQLGTTRGTNALLTRTRARTAFVTTQWFRDLLSLIGDQARPNLFDLTTRKPTPLFETANTRLTDPEVLENRYPVVLRDFSVRAESGGAGIHRGGNGIVREIEFVRPLVVSLLTNRRTTAPYGICGGGPGDEGLNLLIRRDVSQKLAEPEKTAQPMRNPSGRGRPAED